VYAAASSRIFWLFIALIPFLFSIEAGLAFLIIALSIHTAFAAVGGSSWNPWMRDLIPQDRLGAFYSKRMILATGLGIPLSLAAGFYLDYWKKLFPDYELYGYSILFFFFLAFLIGLYSIHRLAMVKEAGEVEEKIVVHELISEVKRPLRNFSTAGGLLHMVQFPFSIVRTRFEKEEERKDRRNR
jgi:hypothetical protein